MLKNLRAIRQERHMTQQQVANHLGITRQALYRKIKKHNL